MSITPAYLSIKTIDFPCYAGLPKNGQKKGKHNYICVGCGRQFIDCYQPHKGYSEEVKRECLKMYVNGMGFRASERIKGVHHTSIINWV
jgi:transposase-like protein